MLERHFAPAAHLVEHLVEVRAVEPQRLTRLQVQAMRPSRSWTIRRTPAGRLAPREVSVDDAARSPPSATAAPRLD